VLQYSKEGSENTGFDGDGKKESVRDSPYNILHCWFPRYSIFQTEWSDLYNLQLGRFSLEERFTKLTIWKLTRAIYTSDPLPIFSILPEKEKNKVSSVPSFLQRDFKFDRTVHRITQINKVIFSIISMFSILFTEETIFQVKIEDPNQEIVRQSQLQSQPQRNLEIGKRILQFMVIDGGFDHKTANIGVFENFEELQHSLSECFPQIDNSNDPKGPFIDRCTPFILDKIKNTSDETLRQIGFWLQPNSSSTNLSSSNSIGEPSLRPSEPVHLQIQVMAGPLIVYYFTLQFYNIIIKLNTTINENRHRQYSSDQRRGYQEADIILSSFEELFSFFLDYCSKWFLWGAEAINFRPSKIQQHDKTHSSILTQPLKFQWTFSNDFSNIQGNHMTLSNERIKQSPLKFVCHLTAYDISHFSPQFITIYSTISSLLREVHLKMGKTSE